MTVACVIKKFLPDNADEYAISMRSTTDTEERFTTKNPLIALEHPRAASLPDFPPRAGNPHHEEKPVLLKGFRG